MNLNSCQLGGNNYLIKTLLRVMRINLNNINIMLSTMSACNDSHVSRTPLPSPNKNIYSSLSLSSVLLSLVAATHRHPRSKDIKWEIREINNL